MLAVLPLLAAAATSSSSRFEILWNCPYSCGILPSAMAQRGVTMNREATFNGSDIALFYGPQTWPSTGRRK